MPKLNPRSWGVFYDSSIPHSNGWRCESDDCSFGLVLTHDAWKDLVGIREDKMIFRCPQCFSLFWVHLSRQSFLEYAQRWCPNFPKEDTECPSSK